MEKRDLKYFLALVRRPGDSKFVDISKLNIAQGFNPQNLADLDSFTLYFTEEELKENIKEDNLIEESYLNGSLTILDQTKKHHYEVLTKNILGDFQLGSFFKDHLADKELMNNIIYKFSTLVNNPNLINQFKEAKEMQNISLILQIIYSVDYLTRRTFFLYLIHLYQKEQLLKNKNQERTRDKTT